MKYRAVLLFLFFCIAGHAFAQSGPGGVGTSATNVLWLSADNQVYNDAGTTLAATTDNVQQWNDRSGNTKHASQTVAGNRPNYVTGVINSLPAIRYSAGNDNLLSTTVATANVSSVWAVAAYASLPSSNPGVLIGAPAGTGTNVGAGSKSIGMWVNNAGTAWGRGIQSNATSRDISQVTSLSNSTFYILNNIYRAATSINQFVNSAAAGNNNSHNGTLSSWTDVTIGRQGNESWNGDIAEVIFYNVEVNSAQRIIIDNYLAAKYGLSLSATDVYDQDIAGNGNYDFEVAGIGQVDASNIHNAAQGPGIVRISSPAGLGNDEFLLWGHDNASLQATNVTDIPVGVQARMARVWRVSEVSASSASVDVGSVTISFDLANLGPVTASDLRLIVDTDNDGVFTDETGISGASLVSGTVYQFAGVTAITDNVRFSLGTVNKAQTPLPVEFLWLTAVLNGDRVDLNWRTATEKNNEYFKIQRSLDGKSWETLGVRSGAGNSSTPRDYSFTDEYPYNLVAYYRIKQCDFDGRTKDSPSVIIDPAGIPEYKIKVYPNPADAKIYVQGEALELEYIQVIDLTGRIMDLKPVYKNAHKAELDVASLLPGIYYIKSKSVILKIVKN